MDEVEQDGPVGETLTVGERLRAAREQAGMTLDELATSTRIPTRHLANLEESKFDKLPAPTYTLGFAKNYATAVGLDRAAIASDLRAELGGTRPQNFELEVYEPADPARSMPIALILGALAAIILVVLGFTWYNNRALNAPDTATPVEAAAEPAAAPATVAAPVVAVTAAQPVWVDIRDGLLILKQGELAAGERFVVPATAQNPLLSTAKPEALAITVGERTAAPVGPAGRRVSDVSLKGEDLLRAPAPAAAAPATLAPAQPRTRPATPPRTAPASPPPAPATTPAETATQATTNGQ